MKIICLFIVLFLCLFSCDDTTYEKVAVNNAQKIGHEVVESEQHLFDYPDYYSGQVPYITEYYIFNCDFSADEEGVSSYYNDVCYSDSGIFYYDIIMDENKIGFHHQNGIIHIKNNGERERICPEESCSLTNLCEHIMMKNISFIEYGDNLYIYGVPYLKGGAYERSCIMQLNLQTKEYKKYAELIYDDAEIWTYSHYLMVTVSTGEQEAVLYCYDLEKHIAYQTQFHSISNGASYEGISNGFIIAKDQYHIYVIDKTGEIKVTYESDVEINNCVTENNIIYIGKDRCIYTYDIDMNCCTVLLENVYFNFSVNDNLIYFFDFELVEGLKYQCPYEGTNGDIIYRIEDYPVYCGSRLYTYDLENRERCVILEKKINEYFCGDIFATDQGIAYSVLYSSEDTPTKLLSANLYKYYKNDEEVTVMQYWNGKTMRWY